MRRAPLLLVSLLLLAGCEPLRDAVAPAASPHEAYARSLQAEFGGTALAADWLAAAEASLQNPIEVEVPFREVAYFDPARPEATAWRLTLQRGQRLLVEAEGQPGDTARVFVDLFRLGPDSLDLRRVASGDPEARALGFRHDVETDGALVLRVQPELLRGGRVVVTVRTEPQLSVFPVAGEGYSAIRSFWGAPRDGGARRHEGIDVFADRGTPVVASAEGTARLRDDRLGGKTVWLRTRAGLLYYAHLDSQLVATGQRVNAGDTLGLVGNTGNARTTPPHLHFGIYGNDGAVDPLPFVDPRPSEPPALSANADLLGTWARLAGSVGSLQSGTPVRIVGVKGSAYRVRGAGGAEAVTVAVTAQPQARVSLQGVALRAAPDASAAVVDSIHGPVPAEVVGASGGFRLVRAADRAGWVAE